MTDDKKGLWLRAALLLVALVVSSVAIGIVLYRIFRDSGDLDANASDTSFEEVSDDDDETENDDSEQRKSVDNEDKDEAGTRETIL